MSSFEKKVLIVVIGLLIGWIVVQMVVDRTDRPINKDFIREKRGLGR